MTDDISSIRHTGPPPSRSKPASDLDAGELRDVIKEGVFRGVMKAVAVYLLISFVIWVIVSIVNEANRYG